MEYIIRNINDFNTEDINNFYDKIPKLKKDKISKFKNYESKVRSIIGEMNLKELLAKNVEIRADQKALAYLTQASEATETDWETEFLDYILAIKVVDSLEEAISHINKYNTKHSEAIVTENYSAAQKFLNEVDAAAVYVNASTRFTDGFVFGFGAEIGISTQKLHARGPMGLDALTSIKYIIYGQGQVRN